MTGKSRLIVFCRCAQHEVVPPAKRDRALRALAASGAELLVVPDLCQAAAERGAPIRRIAGAACAAVVACHPRAVTWLLSFAGVDNAAGRVEVADLRAGEPDAVVRRALGTRRAAGRARAGRGRVARPRGDWTGWFPVIDYARCRGCRQCVSFCPFGVYAADAGKVTVVRPRQCKDNCPACARICPELAIIFPKVADRPINGDRVTAADEVEARRRRDERRDALSRGGLREALARRGAGE